ncbi:M64 family metallopeptidase [Microbacterium terrisoli]|uniref:M64 family metallopeptidase n=1 Tax=Microbacterium terrisoli TaxID=3242192 RepID=UPI002805D6C7|nr:M64 family metallopeptidase [Microbacterium protaetiae]
MSTRTHTCTGVALAALLAVGVALTPTAAATAAPSPATATAVPAAAADDSVDDATVVPVHISGDPAKRWNLVVLGDGFTAGEMDQFDAAVERHLNVMWSLEPYRSYKNYINVYAVQIPSVDSGTSCEDGPNGTRLNTPLNMQFWSGCRTSGVERLLVMNNTAAKKYAALAPKADQILALSNSSLYGGAGGSYATASANNAMSALISPHELGHSFGKLQDEYDYYSRGVTTGDYTGGEPSSKHHTIMSVDQMAQTQSKWWRWLGDFSESGGVIDRYEGGQYYSTGIWRPSQHSMMKSLGFYMDQVSREIVAANISASISLVDQSTPTDAPVARDGKIYVDTVYPVYHALDVAWSVNGTEVSAVRGDRVVDMDAIKAKPGDVVQARIVDPTEFVRDPQLRESKMTETLSWTVGDQAFSGEDVAAGMIRRHSPNDAPVGAKDMLWVHTSHPNSDRQVIEWRIDQGTPGGALLARGPQLDLSTQQLPAGATVKVSVFDRTDRHAMAEVRWKVDNAAPGTEPEIGEAVSSDVDADGVRHYVADDTFTMDLKGTDDQDGYIVSEFRVDGDGWHHYYGWPSDSTAPFRFTPTGLNVDDLIYGNLGTDGISLSPFHERTPGYGTHEIEYRSIDAAGNIAGAGTFRVTVRDPKASVDPTLSATAFAQCRDGRIGVDVSVTNTGTDAVAATATGAIGSAALGSIAAGSTATATIGTDRLAVENGEITIAATGSTPVSITIPQNRYACHA